MQEGVREGPAEVEVSPCISPYLPVSPYISLDLSLPLPTSPYISTSREGPAEVEVVPVVLRAASAARSLASRRLAPLLRVARRARRARLASGFTIGFATSAAAAAASDGAAHLG